jgi:ATP:ADP antiporter, AAA family
MTVDRPAGPLDRLLRVFSDVRAGEGITALLMLLNLFLLLVGYYVVKTVREPLILDSPPPSWVPSGAEMKTYAAAGQAVVLMGFIPLYSWFASRVGRLKLIFGLMLFFIVSFEAFYFASKIGVPYLSFAFFIFVGIFSNAAIAQFWSFANDLYRKKDGERLFPLIALGATVGSPVGAKAAGWFFEAGVGAYEMLHVTAVLLAAHLGLYWIVQQRESRGHEQPAATTPLAAGAGGLPLIFRSRYLGLVALLIVVLNIVNTTGEYLIDRSLLAAADQAAAVTADFNRSAFIGSFKGDYFFWVNVTAVALQALLVSRLVKYAGLAGVILLPTFIAFGAYGLIALGAGFVAVRWAKTAENASDYSIMNTARQMIWLPTTREEKYKAKQAVDTFFVRIGDVLSAFVVLAGTAWLALGLRGFAVANLAFVALWLGVAFVLLREHRRLSEQAEEKAA